MLSIAFAVGGADLGGVRKSVDLGVVEARQGEADKYNVLATLKDAVRHLEVGVVTHTQPCAPFIGTVKVPSRNR